MKTLLLTILSLLFCSCGAQEKPEGTSMTNPKVTIKTSQGVIKAELYQNKVPETVTNFLSYIDKKHYDGTIFHRVIDNFMIQGGGYNADFSEKPTGSPIKNEAQRTRTKPVPNPSAPRSTPYRLPNLTLTPPIFPLNRHKNRSKALKNCKKPFKSHSFPQKTAQKRPLKCP